MEDRQCLDKAALCEMLSLSFRLPDRNLVRALAEGKFAETAMALSKACGLEKDAVNKAVRSLAGYEACSGSIDDLLVRLNVEYTGLLVGAPIPRVSPYAGSWWAKERGMEPLFFVNERSRAIKGYMLDHGVVSKPQRNEPLDHIATMLEFLQYCYLASTGAVEAHSRDEVTLGTPCEFSTMFLVDWAPRFFKTIEDEAEEAFYRVAATIAREFLEGVG